MKRALILAACLALTACAHTQPAEPVTVVQRVEIPVSTPCKVDIGPDPQYPDTDEALRSAPGLFERVQLLVAGRLLRIARDLEKTAALRGCAGEGR